MKRTIIVLEDDIDGGEAHETVAFALDGSTYEIDLSDTNAAALRDALAPYAGAGRRQSGTRRNARRSSPGKSGKAPSGARAWAVANGFQMSDRGPIPVEVKKAWEHSQEGQAQAGTGADEG